jgi:hypothetical protein
MAVDAAAATGSLRTIGTGATQACAGNDARLTDSRTPTAHKTSHENNGSDEINVAGLSGTLADPQTPTAHATSHQTGGSDELQMPKLGAPTYPSLWDFSRFVGTSGRVTGGTMTDAGSGNLNVSAGTGYIRPSNSNTAELYAFDWAASNGNAIPASTVRYVGVKYNGGAPIVDIRTTDSWNYHDEFPLGMVANVGGTLHINTDGRNFPDQLGRLIRRFYGTLPYDRDERTGGLVLGETGARKVTLSAGKLWDRSNDYDIAAIDTSAAGTFTAYYRDGAGGFTEVTAQTAWPNTQYDDNSGTLVTMTNNRYAVLWFYLETDGDLVMLYGRGQYTSVALAKAEGSPSTVPARITASGRLVARIIFQKSASTSESIETVWGVSLNPTGVTDHGSLAGLSDSDHAPSALAFAATQRVAGRNTAGSGAGEEVTLSQLLDWIGTVAQGDILYRGAAGWERLAAGASGKFLKTLGAGANPAWDTVAAGAHAASHENGGADEINVGGLSGVLADLQNPLAHAANHVSGGPDAIKLDDLAAPDDNTDLNVSITKHGLTPKAPNSVAQFLRGDATWAIPTVTATPDPQVIYNIYACPFQTGAL